MHCKHILFTDEVVIRQEKSSSHGTSQKHYLVLDLMVGAIVLQKLFSHYFKFVVPFPALMCPHSPIVSSISIGMATRWHQKQRRHDQFSR